MNKFYKKISLYNKLNNNIQNIVLNKLFEKHKKWSKNTINESIKFIHKIKYRFFLKKVL